ncbi:hypothetical protein RvY_06793 [Ramazzottius varieornatus]|uniref:Uncharacterized protein n=1 Tax=Ramazzottius varieornatus TaxID=947166 RepID=A0A1D1V9C4_RAMVA|nr:hypothetical protein RvY_06793 [Ramazzottius varieornatus]
MAEVKTWIKDGANCNIEFHRVIICAIWLPTKECRHAKGTFSLAASEGCHDDATMSNPLH